MDTNAVKFKKFLDGWLVRQDQLLEDLTRAQSSIERHKDEDLQKLVSRALALYQEFFEEKSHATERNTFGMYAPPWSSPFESVFLWITGFKPTSLIQVVFNSNDDLSSDQIRRLGRLKDGTKAEERALADELARIQESVAAPPIIDSVRRVRKQLDAGKDGTVEGQAMENLSSALQTIVIKADLLRTATATRILEILTLQQGIKFLAAAAQLQKHIRMWAAPGTSYKHQRQQQ